VAIRGGISKPRSAVLILRVHLGSLKEPHGAEAAIGQNKCKRLEKILELLREWRERLESSEFRVVPSPGLPSCHSAHRLLYSTVEGANDSIASTGAIKTEGAPNQRLRLAASFALEGSISSGATKVGVGSSMLRLFHVLNNGHDASPMRGIEGFRLMVAPAVYPELISLGGNDTNSAMGAPGQASRQLESSSRVNVPLEIPL